MKRLAVVLLVLSSITACSGILEKQEPICYGIALIAGQETSVPIYGIRKLIEQTQYRAGGPFGWHWVSKTNFTRTTCDK
ncbi:phage exclusion lipoprotein Cor [Serratia marcescens]|uniref:phage exclusion lipoprotein Cor n=1 Tax=Serratia marcescens TaxID=615 RepID=UPI000665539E|nr:hypothetical protein [Serratia marcescens]AVE52348.1 cor protein [Serratia marcescens]MBH2972782.1 cor protein [Serratia marcescens]MBH2977259.1 cor protein [Serratia marcescens]MBN3987969.1 cor protein [Serratia marcescens]MBN5326498.1 cor protein [Serratia marcescens]